MASVFSSPWGPLNNGDLGLGNDITMNDIGPQADGTYNYPAAAQPTNSPVNTAGNPPITSTTALDVMKFGTGILQYMAQWDIAKTAIDKRYEATNGGLYRQGVPAGTVRLQNGQVNPSFTMFLLIGIGILLLTHKGA